MPEAVIVDAVRTPIGRAVKGSLEGHARRRPRRRPAARAAGAQPRGRLRADRRHHVGAAGHGASRATTSAATRRCSPGIDHHVPAVTLNRFCASSLQSIRMAFHAIKAGEGDQYIAGGVGGRVARGRRARPVRPDPRSTARRVAVRRLHPDGDDGRERRRALQRLARGAGRVGGRSRRRARSTRRRAGTSTARSSRSRCPTAPW